LLKLAVIRWREDTNNFMLATEFARGHVERLDNESYTYRVCIWVWLEKTLADSDWTLLLLKSLQRERKVEMEKNPNMLLSTVK
jgi:hypothetical protein